MSINNQPSFGGISIDIDSLSSITNESGIEEVPKTLDIVSFGKCDKNKKNYDNMIQSLQTVQNVSEWPFE